MTECCTGKDLGGGKHALDLHVGMPKKLTFAILRLMFLQSPYFVKERENETNGINTLDHLIQVKLTLFCEGLLCAFIYAICSLLPVVILTFLDKGLLKNFGSW